MDKSIKSIIVDKLKAQGISVLEDSIAAGAKGIINALPEIAAAVKSPTLKIVFGIFAASLKASETAIMEAIDGLDGEDDPGRGVN